MKTHSLSFFQSSYNTEPNKRDNFNRSQSIGMHSQNQTPSTSFYVPMNHINSGFKLYSCNLCIITTLMAKETQSLIYHLSSQALQKNEVVTASSPKMSNSSSPQNNNIQSSIYGDSYAFFIPLIEPSTNTKSSLASIRCEIAQFRREAINIEWKAQLKNIDTTIFLFDLSSKESFDDLNDLFNQYVKYSRKKANENPVLLIGKVFNQHTKKVVSNERIIAWCEKRQSIVPILYFEYSNAEAIGISNILEAISEKYQTLFNNYRVDHPLSTPEASGDALDLTNAQHELINRKSSDSLELEDRPKTWVALEQAMRAQLEADREEEQTKAALSQSYSEDKEYDHPIIQSRSISRMSSEAIHRSTSLSPEPYVHPLTIFHEEINIEDILGDDHDEPLTSRSLDKKYLEQDKTPSSLRKQKSSSSNSSNREDHINLKIDFGADDEALDRGPSSESTSPSKTPSTKSTPISAKKNSGRWRLFDLFICGCGAPPSPNS